MDNQPDPTAEYCTILAYPRESNTEVFLNGSLIGKLAPNQEFLVPILVDSQITIRQKHSKVYLWVFGILEVLMRLCTFGLGGGGGSFRAKETKFVVKKGNPGFIRVRIYYPLEEFRAAWFATREEADRWR